MAIRTADYSIWERRYNANYPHDEHINVLSPNYLSSFILLPPWVADKIELMGGNSAKLLPRHRNHIHTFSPSDGDSYDCPSLGDSKKGIKNRGVSGRHKVKTISHYQYDANQPTSRELHMLSGEDIVDIGLLHFVLAEAFNTVNHLAGLINCSYHRATSKHGDTPFIRTNTFSSTRCAIWEDGNNNKVYETSWKFGETTLYEMLGKTSDTAILDSFFEEVNVSENPMIAYSKSYLNGRFPFTIGKGVTRNDFLAYALKRLKNCCTEIPERIKRDSEIASVVNNQGVMSIIATRATVLNVVNMLLENREDVKVIREQLLALLELVVENIRRWKQTQGVANQGLILLYTQLL